MPILKKKKKKVVDSDYEIVVNPPILYPKTPGVGVSESIDNIKRGILEVISDPDKLKTF